EAKAKEGGSNGGEEENAVNDIPVEASSTEANPEPVADVVVNGVQGDQDQNANKPGSEAKVACNLLILSLMRLKLKILTHKPQLISQANPRLSNCSDVQSKQLGGARYRGASVQIRLQLPPVRQHLECLNSSNTEIEPI
ncbi:hypothetical protein HN51_015764, partial [Arachis hypogaea]